MIKSGELSCGAYSILLSITESCCIVIDMINGLIIIHDYEL